MTSPTQPVQPQLVGYNGVVATIGNDKMVDMLQQNLENIDSGASPNSTSYNAINEYT